jgi:hypothetical protein
VQEFIRTQGVTVCPPSAPRDSSPVGAPPGDAGFDWRNRGTPEIPEQRLAKAKVLVMLQNLGGRSREQKGSNSQHPQGHRGFVRDEAHRWFFGRSDFEQWCDTAGLNPDFVREKAKQVYENGLPPSAASRQGHKLPPMSSEEKRIRRNTWHREYQKRRRRCS